MNSRLWIAAAGIVILLFGLAGLLAPQRVLGVLGLATLNASTAAATLGEVRATYGGLFTVMGAYALFAAVNPAAREHPALGAPLSRRRGGPRLRRLGGREPGAARLGRARDRGGGGRRARARRRERLRGVVGPAADGAAARGLRAHRRQPYGGARRARRLHRLALSAALRLRRLFRCAARHAGARPLAPRAGRRGARDRASLPRRHPRARDRLRGPRRGGPHRRLHAAAPGRAGGRAHGLRAARPGADAHAARDPLRLRAHRAVGAPPRGRHAHGDRGAGRALPAHAGGAARARLHHRGAVYRGRGRARAVYAPVVSFAPPAAARGRPGARGGGDRAVVAALGGALHVHGTVARGRSALARHAARARLRGPAGSWPRRPRRCPSRRAACATGTT